MNVAICTPHGGLVRPDYYKYIHTMQASCRQHFFLFVEVDTMIVGKARNMGVQAALTQNVDVIWQVDDDVLVPQDASVLVDQCMELGVVSALYYNRRIPFTPQAYMRATEPGLEEMYWPITDVSPGQGLRRVDAVGAGCLLCRTSIYRDMIDSWTGRCKRASELIDDPSISGYVRNLSPWYEFLDRKGEDLYFSERLSDLGIPLWLNTNVVCGHIGDTVVDNAQFTYLRDNNMLKRVPVSDATEPEIVLEGGV